MNKPYADEATFRRVGPLLILLLAVLALIMAAVAGLSSLWNVDDVDERTEQSHHGLAPALETAPQPSLQGYLVQKQSLADSYSWINPAQHLARIPIEEAMNALAAQSELPPGPKEIYLMGVDSKAGVHLGKDAATARLQRTEAPRTHIRTEQEP